MTASDSAYSRPRRGFNLVEAAIVLGVVGLVIGGIWVAAAAVSDSFKSTESAKAILQTVNAVRVFYTANRWSPEIQDGSGQTSIIDLAVAANIVPGNMLKDSSGFLHLPSGQRIVGLTIQAPPINTPTQIYWQINPISQRDAHVLLREIIKASNNEIVRIFCSNGSGAVVDYAWNMNLSCPSDMNNLVLYFHLFK